MKRKWAPQAQASICNSVEISIFGIDSQPRWKAGLGGKIDAVEYIAIKHIADIEGRVQREAERESEELKCRKMEKLLQANGWQALEFVEIRIVAGVACVIDPAVMLIVE